MQKLVPQIGLKSAIFIVISVIVGSGVFKKIAPMSAELGSPVLVILCWVLAGLISLAGALSTAELASMYPDSGGEYVYYQKIYGRFFAFLFGWANFAVLQTAAIAALAYIFAESLIGIFPVSGIETALSIKLVASLLIVTLTWMNYKGVTFAENVNRILTYTMLSGVILFIVAGLLSNQGSIHHLVQKSSNFSPQKLEGWNILKAMTVASLGAFWGYQGWNNVGFIGEEIKNPKRNLPLALGVGTIIVMLIYISLNVIFTYVLPIDYFIRLNQMPDKIAAVEVATHIMGKAGMLFVSCLILVTTLNSTNSSILTSARMFYAMARDRLFFKKAALVHPKYKTPGVALVLQGIWSVLLVWSGNFDQLTDMLIFASFLYYGSTALGVIIMRIRHPEAERKYKVIGYPFVPALFSAFCIWLFVVTIINQPYESIRGLLLIAIGIPFYWLFSKKKTGISDPDEITVS